MTTPAVTPHRAAPVRRLVPPYGATYDGAVDLGALRDAHRPAFTARTTISVDGNVAAALPFVQWWRAPIVAGFPITPATKWLEYLAQQATTRGAPRVKLLEAEHAVADYLAGVASACRGLVIGTATSSVGLDHMTESLRSLGASGLGNVIVVDVCRATANYPLCIEGDPSDVLAHRDDGFVQVMCRGRQQIYDTLLQLPAIGMHPAVLTPTMPAYYGVKDSHRGGALIVEPDDAVNDFLDGALAAGEDGGPTTPPGLLDGDTGMGTAVTSGWFQGFKAAQKARLDRVPAVMRDVAARFATRFGRPGITALERHGDADPDIALVTMGPDAGTALHLIESLRRELRVRIALIVVRLLSPFPARELVDALTGAGAIAVINNAHHHGRGHLTLDLADALTQVRRTLPPIESFFCGLGGADVSAETWRLIARVTCETAARGRTTRPWHLVHDGIELGEER